jgi:hypothetical protein
MEGIKLSSRGGIESPSGKKITASTIEQGKTYLNKNHIFLREVLGIIGNNVQYYDQPIEGYGLCSKQHFAATCPNEATQAEIDFIMSQKKR